MNRKFRVCHYWPKVEKVLIVINVRDYQGVKEMAFFSFLDKSKKRGASIPVPPPKEIEEFPMPEEPEPIEEHEIEEIKEHPIFVDVHNYDEVLGSIKGISHQMLRSEEGVDKLNSTHNQNSKSHW